MLNIATGILGIPGILEELESVESEVTWGPSEYNRSFRVPVVFSGAARDSQNTPTTVLRPGLLLGRISASGKIKEWSPTATDGSQRLFGVLLAALDTQNTPYGDEDKWVGLALTGGLLKSAKLLIPGEATYGLDNDTLTGLGNYAKALLSGRFQLDTNYHDQVAPTMFGGWSSVRHAASGPVTLVEADNNTLFTNKGASGSVTFNLPAIAGSQGLRFGFMVYAAQNIVIQGPAASTVMGDGDVGQTYTVTGAAGEGSYVEVLGLDNTVFTCSAVGLDGSQVAVT